jgi:hypothetical protein
MYDVCITLHVCICVDVSTNTNFQHNLSNSFKNTLSCDDN